MLKYGQRDMVQRAGDAAATEAGISSDFAALLFPKSDVHISDRMLSNGRQYLNVILAEIESRICRIALKLNESENETLIAIEKDRDSQTLPILDKAGLLKKDDIAEHLFIQVQTAELAARLLHKTSQDELEATFTKYLDHENSAVANAAMGLLVAQSHSFSNGNQISANIGDMPVETLFALVWAVSAALTKVVGLRDTELRAATERVLGEIDESTSVPRCSQRLAQLLERDTESTSFPHPIDDGLTLFVARMAHKSGLANDQIIKFTAQPEMAQLIITMRALDVPSHDAVSVFAALDNGDNILTPATYNGIDRDKAMALLSDWSAPVAFQQAKRLMSDEHSDAFAG